MSAKANRKFHDPSRVDLDFNHMILATLVSSLALRCVLQMSQKELMMEDEATTPRQVPAMASRSLWVGANLRIIRHSWIETLEIT